MASEESRNFLAIAIRGEAKDNSSSDKNFEIQSLTNKNGTPIISKPTQSVLTDYPAFMGHKCKLQQRPNGTPFSNEEDILGRWRVFKDLLNPVNFTP